MEHSENAPAEAPDVEKLLARAWQRAFLVAVSTPSRVVTAEALLVGLVDEFGDAILRFFTDETILRSVVDRSRPRAVEDCYSRLLPPDESPTDACQSTVGFPGLCKSDEYESIMRTVLHEVDTSAPKLLSLSGFMKIFAHSLAADRLAREYNLRFRG